MNKQLPLNRLNRHQGFAMIEALVSILILSIGVLGMVGMQSASIRYEQNSWARSAVSMMASDISDRIRANAGSSDNAYVYSTSYAAERTLIDAGSAFSVTTDCNSASCTPAQLATYDLIKWRENLNRQAPGAVGLVTGSRDKNYSVTIAWFDKSRVTGKNTVGSSAPELESSDQCTDSMVTAAARNCCPKALGDPSIKGVRCVNFAVLP